MTEISKNNAIEILEREAFKIKQLITNQQNYECITQCRAFEEVVDTHMFGFSKQVEYAQRIGIIDRDVAQHMVIELEQELNDVYATIYSEKNEMESEQHEKKD